MSKFTLNAIVRGEELQGKGASRRLRKQNLVPSIIYGGGKDPKAVSLKINELVRHLEDEAFFSSIINITIEGDGEEQAIIKALQRHPARGYPMHADFQRIVKGQMISMSVPVHFEGADSSTAIKSGGILSTLVADLDISCIPSQIPEYLSIDISSMDIGDSLHLSDITLPEGVTLDDLEAGTDRTIANLQAPKVEKEPTAEAEADDEASEEQSEEGDEE